MNVSRLISDLIPFWRTPLPRSSPATPDLAFSPSPQPLSDLQESLTALRRRVDRLEIELQGLERQGMSSYSQQDRRANSQYPTHSAPTGEVSDGLLLSDEARVRDGSYRGDGVQGGREKREFSENDSRPSTSRGRRNSVVSTHPDSDMTDTTNPDLAEKRSKPGATTCRNTRKVTPRPPESNERDADGIPTAGSPEVSLRGNTDRLTKQSLGRSKSKSIVREVQRRIRFRQKRARRNRNLDKTSVILSLRGSVKCSQCRRKVRPSKAFVRAKSRTPKQRGSKQAISPTI
ncbi:uncharacterized protein PV07_12795 [Cladophialophora immunda]|uniref:Uncharacterized protein n=1 Tax=Cladophialophora immunda TaxID=569365 RepID=A0A0D2AAH5_9EURO|nr:uncharacterized protein PV07_12795 [Cladophialophora immunda]KIW21777.1 hypothetical protein PV07_12795 [Cladophialophora immunda]